MKRFTIYRVHIKQETDDEAIETHHCKSNAEAIRKANELIEDFKQAGDAEDYYVSLEIIKAEY